MLVANKQYIQLSLFFVVLMLVFGFYSLGLNGPFLLDDFNNLSGIGTGDGVVQLSDLMRYVFSVDGSEFCGQQPVSNR